MTRRSPRPLSQRLHSLYSWHRWLGICAAAFILVFAVTGLSLNHSAALGLDRSYLTHAFWHRLYAFDEQSPVLGLKLGPHWLSQAGGRVYFDQRFVSAGPPPLGAIPWQDQWIAAFAGELWLLDSQGALIERIGPSQLPGRITAIGQTDAQILLQTAYAIFAGTLDSLNWRPVDTDIPWTKPGLQTPPAAISSAVRQDLRAHRLTLERLLLDLHSGRLFGQLGVLLMDSAAVLLLLLAVSGPWLWLHLRRRLKRRRERLRQT